MFEKWRKKRELRQEAVQKAREKYTSWLEIAQSNGWKAYQEEVEKEINLIRNKFENETELPGEDLKRLQLAFQVWKKVQRIPKKLEDNAKGGK